MEENTLPYNPVEIQLASETFYSAPGGSVEVPFLLVNRTGQENYFEINVRGLPVGWVRVDTPVIHMGPDERSQVSITIQPPPGMVGHYAAALHVANQADATQAGQAGFELRVEAFQAGGVFEPGGVRSGGFDSSSFPSTLPLAGGSWVGLSMEEFHYSVTPGERVDIPLRLTNHGYGEDIFQIAIEGLPVTWVSSSTPTVRLQPGEEREVLLYVQPARLPSSRAGRHPFRIHISSQMDPSQAAVSECLLTIGPFSQFASELVPLRMETSQTARIRIHNLGNIPDTYTVVWQNRNGNLEFAPSYSGPVQVMPGEVASIDFAASPGSPNWFDRTNTFSYTVTIQSSDGEAQAHSGEVISRSLIPVWVLPAVAVFCLTAICGVGALWNWNQNRLSVATQTADAQIAFVQMETATAAANQTAAVAAGQQDTDGDGLTDREEQDLGTNPQAPDTDNDRMNDADELAMGLDPTNPDTDGDGVVDGLDINPLNPDNPSQTETALAGRAPTATETAIPQATATFTTAPQPTATPAEVPAPTQTSSPVVIEEPTQTSSPPPTPSSTSTLQPTETATETVIPLPVTGQQLVLFQSDIEGSVDIFLLDLADRTVTRLTGGEGENEQPVWSPDGSRILFTSSRDGNREIYVMNADGSEAENLTGDPADDSDPAWSPDGSRIAFTSDRDGSRDIFVMDADGSNVENLTDDPAEDHSPAWYSNRILFVTDRDGNDEIYVMDEDGSDPENLTDDPAGDLLPAALPDGDQIAFVSDRDGNLEVYVMDEDGGDQRNVTQNPAEDTQPAWSANGEWILFATDRDGNQEIYVIRPDGDDAANLTRSSSNESAPSWR